jgi:hypothetical protein
MCDPDSGERPGLDVLYELLASQRRRHVLQELHAADAVLGVDQLAYRIVNAEEEDAAPGAVGDGSGPRSIERTVARLSHVDLPKLAAANLVCYDSDERTVEATDELEQVLPLLDPFDGD